MDFDTVDFICPLSGELIQSEPVTLNGHVYDRDTLEDWIYRSEFLDPLYIFDNYSDMQILSKSVIESNQTDPNQIKECSPEFLQIFLAFKFHTKAEEFWTTGSTCDCSDQESLFVGGASVDLNSPIHYPNDSNQVFYFDNYFSVEDKHDVVSEKSWKTVENM